MTTGDGVSSAVLYTILYMAAESRERGDLDAARAATFGCVPDLEVPSRDEWDRGGRFLLPDQAGLHQAARLLRAGGVVAFPTDTVYGLAALASDAAARGRIYEIKRRDRSQQLILMAARPDELEALVEIDV